MSEVPVIVWAGIAVVLALLALTLAVGLFFFIKTWRRLARDQATFDRRFAESWTRIERGGCRSSDPPPPI